MSTAWDDARRAQDSGSCSHRVVGVRHVSGSPAASGVIYQGLRCLGCGEVLQQWCYSNPLEKIPSREELRRIAHARGAELLD